MDATGILVPILVSVVLSVAGAFAVARYSGPAQTQYVDALKGRLAVVERERDDVAAKLPKHEARIAQLEARVAELEETNRKQAAELLELYRRLDADEHRLEADEARLPHSGAK